MGLTMTFSSVLHSLYSIENLRAYALALAVTLAIVLALFLFRHLLVSRLKKVVIKTSTELDDFGLSLLENTKKSTIIALGILIGLHFIELAPGIHKIAISSIILIFLFQIWFWGREAIEFLAYRLVRQDRVLAQSDELVAGAVPAIQFVGRLALISLIVIVGLDNFGVDITALVTSLGIGGIAVALALQNILGDLFASLSIVLDKPFRPGDFIVVGDAAGVVEKIGLKTTRLRSLSGEQLVFSNGDLLASRVRNFKQMTERRMILKIRILYQTPLDKIRKAQDLIRSAIEKQDGVRFDRAHFISFGESSLDFEAIYFILAPEYGTAMDKQQAINLEIMKLFAQEGIDFAFPTRTLFIQQDTTANKTSSTVAPRT